LGGSGGFIVPNPGQGTPMLPENPMFRLVPNRFGKQNVVPAFEQQYGPIREVRLKYKPDGTRDGGVHQLWVVTGIKTDPTLTNCSLTQPDFAGQFQAGNLSFRIPLQMLGLGLIESIQDREILKRFNATANQRAGLGISGHPNRSGNDGTITRFGWKAQNKSLLIFSGEAYNVEQGVTSEAFPNERDDTQGCRFNATPEDSTNLAVSEPTNSPASDFSSDVVNFAAFMRLSAAPTPATPTNTTVQGSNQFVNIGCGRCHIPQHMTAQSPFGNQNPVTITPLSDFALHNLGTGLQDQVSQGAANGQQFRTAPLWGIGQRVFFLHDGRTNSLVAAVEAHASTGSEANQVVNNFNLLSPSDQQAIITYLRSL
jgi:CxxC motif-containing protein (DUF1111 family)